MAKAPRSWTVTAHGPVEKLDDNLWAVESWVPGVPGLKRRMTIVCRPDGTLLFFNAVPVGDAALAQILTLGRPRDLVIPQHLHMLDAYAFRAKLGVRVYAPAAGRALVAQRVQVDGTFEDLPRDAAVEVGTVAGFKTGEGFLTVRSASRTSLVVADLVLNLRRGPGLRGLLFHLLGFTGQGPMLPAPVRWRVLRDRKALQAQLEQLATTPGLVRIVPSHGAVIESGAPQALRAIAGAL